MEVHQRSCGTTLIGPEAGARTQRGIALRLVCALAVRFYLAPDVRAEEIGHAGRLSGSKVEHASADGMPRRTAGHIHVDVVLVREVRTEHVEDIDLSSRGGRGVGVAFFVGRQWLFVGMCTGIRAGNALYGSIGEDDGAVASQQVAAIETFANEQRILIREVIVGRVELVETATIVGQQQGRASRLRFAACSRDPKRRVGVAQEKLTPRQGRPRIETGPAACRDGDGRNQDGNPARSGARREHRGKYTAQ